MLLYEGGLTFSISVDEISKRIIPGGFELTVEEWAYLEADESNKLLKD